VKKTGRIQRINAFWPGRFDTETDLRGTDRRFRAFTAIAAVLRRRLLPLSPGLAEKILSENVRKILQDRY
jgi:hypothetical protein